jgi:hypothetical protein
LPDRGSGLLPSRLLRRSLIGAAAVALVGMVLWGLQKASAGISFDAIVAGIRATSPTALLGSFAATFLSFIALLGYDLSGLRYAGARPPFTAALLASFCGFAIGNTVGLGAFSGGAVRYRLYSAAGLSPGQIARVIFFYRDRLRHRTRNDHRAWSRPTGERGEQIARRATRAVAVGSRGHSGIGNRFPVLLRGAPEPIAARPG